MGIFNRRKNALADQARMPQSTPDGLWLEKEVSLIRYAYNLEPTVGAAYLPTTLNGKIVPASQPVCSFGIPDNLDRREVHVCEFDTILVPDGYAVDFSTDGDVLLFDEDDNACHASCDSMAGNSIRVSSRKRSFAAPVVPNKRMCVSFRSKTGASGSLDLWIERLPNGEVALMRDDWGLKQFSTLHAASMCGTWDMEHDRAICEPQPVRARRL